MIVVFPYTDHGDVQLVCMSILSHHRETSQDTTNDDNAEFSATMERNIKGLTLGIPRTRMGEIPYHLHSHVVGVLDSINSLLRWVAQEVVCYHEHNMPIDV